MKGPRKNGRAVGVDGALRHPPTITPQIKQTLRLRFTCTTAAVAKAIRFQDLTDAVNVAATATTAFCLFDLVKLREVEVWAIPVQGNAPQTVTVQFAGQSSSVDGDGRLFSDTSMGISPAHVRCRPEPLSVAGLWQDQNANTAFLLTCPIAAVVDVTVSYRTIPTLAPVATSVAPAGATAGELYFRGLDGAAAAGTTLPAVAPTTN